MPGMGAVVMIQRAFSGVSICKSCQAPGRTAVIIHSSRCEPSAVVQPVIEVRAFKSAEPIKRPGDDNQTGRLQGIRAFDFFSRRRTRNGMANPVVQSDRSSAVLMKEWPERAAAAAIAKSKLPHISSNGHVASSWQLQWKNQRTHIVIAPSILLIIQALHRRDANPATLALRMTLRTLRSVHRTVCKNLPAVSAFWSASLTFLDRDTRNQIFQPARYRLPSFALDNH